MAKPFKGQIHNWNKEEYQDGYVIWGVPVGHPEFKNWMHTSLVLEMFEIPRHLDEPRKFHIETLDSQYELIGDEVPPPC